jgi:hypothetical protein
MIISAAVGEDFAAGRLTCEETMRRANMILIGLVVLAGACTNGTDREMALMRSAQAQPRASKPVGATPPAATPPASAQPTAGDSILPMEIMISRFQADHPIVSSLDDVAAGSRDALVARVMEAVADSNAAALHALTMNAAEFGQLYFPTSIYSREPYAQPPEVTWLLMSQNSRKGLVRLLREYGGQSLVVAGYSCDGEPKVQGSNRIHELCRVRIRGADGRVEEVRLFGSIIERGGRFKLMSLSNRL